MFKNIGTLSLQKQKIRNHFMSESSYIAPNFFTENLLAIELKKTQILINKPTYLGSSILYLSIIFVMYEFWYGYLKPKSRE